MLRRREGVKQSGASALTFMRQRPSSLFMHRFYQTPAVASVWIDALELLACWRGTKNFQLFLLFADLAIENWLSGRRGQLIAKADLLLLAGLRGNLPHQHAALVVQVVLGRPRPLK